MKRERKSLKEIWQVDGQAKEHKKIFEDLKIGNGKSLLEAQWGSLIGMLGVCMPLSKNDC